jgi:hypothetical protein
VFFFLNIWECVSIRSATERIYEEEPPSKSVGCAVASLASPLLLPRLRTKNTPPIKTSKPALTAVIPPGPKPPRGLVLPPLPLPIGDASPGRSVGSAVEVSGAEDPGNRVDPSGVFVVVVVASEEPVCSVVGPAGRVVAVGVAVRKAVVVAVGEASGEREGSNVGVAVGRASGEREGSNVGPAVGSRVGARSQGSASEGREAGMFAAESFGEDAGEETDTRKSECFVWNGRNILRIAD